MINLQIETKATEFLGNAFVAFPRSVFNLLFLSDRKGQLAGILYTALISKVFFAKGHLKIGSRVFDCNPGEYISSHQDLAAYCGMKRRTYFNALKWLINAGLVETVPLANCTHFFLSGYMLFSKKVKSGGKVSPKISSATLQEAERRMGGRSMQFNDRKKGGEA